MSHLAFVYGVITSAMAGPDDAQHYHRLNSAAIGKLPENDEYPPLSKTMFAVTEGPLTYWQTRAIHFGWTTKNFDLYASDWIVKFEQLLMELYWWEARVHMELEINGRTEIHWELDAASGRNWKENGLKLPNHWDRTILADAGIQFADSIGQSNAG